MNAQLAAPVRAALEELGHPQPAAPAKAGSSAASGTMSGATKQQRSKATDMRFYWLKDRAEQGQFKICWAPGDESWADYFTKHHSGNHRQALRPCYLKEKGSPGGLQGCLERLRSLLGKRPQSCGQQAPAEQHKVAQMPAIMPYASTKRRMPMPMAMPTRSH